MSQSDQLFRFLFKDLDIRGELVCLQDSWQQIQARHDYPDAVAQQLGEALAAVTLLSATLKIDGSLILQVQAQGPLRTLVAQATHQGEIRGIARWQGDVPQASLPEVFGEGQLVMTARSRQAESHQSLVALEGQSLSQALEHYFEHSEQLRSAFWLFVNRNSVVGLFLQQLPARQFRPEDWEHITTLAATITPEELSNLDAETVLHRLFHEEHVQLFPPSPVRFACSCSAEKIENTLFSMGKASLQDILDSEGAIDVHCEFCGKHYHYQQDSIEALFAQHTPDDGQLH